VEVGYRNRPSSGPLFNAMKDCKYKYKIYLRNQKKKSVNGIKDSLNECLVNNSKTEFWKTWKAKFGGRNTMASSIHGLLKPFKIANKFADVFADACSPFSFDRLLKHVLNSIVIKLVHQFITNLSLLSVLFSWLKKLFPS